MIEKFDYYDLYGYVLPGLATLALVPLAMLWFGVPLGDPDLGEAVLVLAGAYLIGFVLHEIARAAIPSTFSARVGGRRMPSSYLLDELSPGSLESAYVDAVKRAGGPELAGMDTTLDAVRNARFLLARETLMQRGLAAHANHQQGLQALCRGLCAVAVLAALLGLEIGLMALFGLPAASAGAGPAWIPWAFAVLATISARLAFLNHRRRAEEFAKAVMRSYAVM